ncbi:MAG: MMPL family transporter [Chloroflexi bacterium]|nr:MMPL family transporter [Chloroflexota bacterium]
MAWSVAAIAALAFAPSLAKVGSTDQSSFLPPATESVRARVALERAFPREVSAGSATITFSRESGLTDADRAYIAETAAWITGPDAPADLRDIVSSVQTPVSEPELESLMRSTDGKLELMTVNLTVNPLAGGDRAVEALRAHFGQSLPAGMQAHVTGSAGISVDYMSAILRGTDSTLLVTIVLVVIILLLVYRAPLAALVPLATIGVAYLVSRGVLGYLADAGWKISSLLDTFVVVLVFGVGTDYTIFLISRYREEVSKGDWHAASRMTVKRIGAVITASAATVIVGLGSMAFGEFGMIQTTGPALAIVIFVTLLVGLTLAPALLGIFGHYLFWPRHERDESSVDAGSLFARLATLVSHRPALVTGALVLALALPITAIPSSRTNFDATSDLPKDSDARLGFELVTTHLGKGRIMPVNGAIEIGVDTDFLSPASLAQLRDATQAVAGIPGVQSVTSLISPTGDGTVPAGFVPSKQLEAMADGFAKSGGEAKDLLDPDVTSGLRSAADYVDALATPFPSIATSSEYARALADLRAAPDLIVRLHDGALVSNQLRTMGGALGASTAPATDPRVALQALGNYLQELLTAYPDTAQLPAFATVRTSLLSLQQTPSAAAITDLGAGLAALATAFDARPDAVLFPKSLPVTPAGAALQQQIASTFGRLPGDLRALAGQYAARPDDLFVPTTLRGDGGSQAQAAAAAYVSEDGTVQRLFIITDEDPYSVAAFDTVRRARVALAPFASGFGIGANAVIGGATAELADTQTALNSDFLRVAVITVLGVLVVLTLLLRAIVAPIYLVLTVLLSYLATIGFTSWLYQSVLGQPGVNFFLPLMVFVLLVALGSDYNIFLMSRVREESEHRPIREGIRVASGRTGAVITSAGLILAGTFGSMASAPLIVLFQIGLAVGVGVLIDTFVVRSILVPAVTTLVGDRAWWPSRRRGEGGPAAPPDQG